MRKLILIGVIGFLVLQSGYAQPPNLILNWSDAWTPTTPAFTQGHCVTANNNLVVSAGNFNGTVDFDPGAAVLNQTSPTSSSDMYLQCLTPPNSLLWVRRIGGAGSGTEIPRRVVMDASSVYVTGQYSILADFNLIPFSGGTINSVGGDDIFLAKFDFSGNLLWVRSFGGVGQDQGWGITLDAAGNVIICGSFSDVAQFNPGGSGGTLTSAGGTDAFFASYSSAGVFQYARRVGGQGNDNAYNITVSAAGNIVLCGSYGSADCDFNPGLFFNWSPPPGAYSGLLDAYVAQYNSAGSFLWAAGYGSIDNDHASDIVTDAAGNIYVTGSVGANGIIPTSSFTTGGGPISLINPGLAGTADIVVLQLTNTGAVGAWAPFRVGNANDDVGTSIALDGPTDIYVAGYFSNFGVDFDNAGPIAPPPHSAGTQFDIFFARYQTATGLLTEVVGIGDVDTDRPRDICTVNNTTTLYCTGGFQNTVNFDPLGAVGGIENSTGGSENAFLVAYNYAFVPTIILADEELEAESNTIEMLGEDQTQTTETELKYYPNPTSGTVYLENISEGTVVEIYGVDGSMVYSVRAFTDGQLRLNLDELTSGVYLISVHNADGTLTNGKIIKQ